MKENGNPTQWGDFWPSEEKIKEDIANNISFVVVTPDDEIVAAFAFVIGIDETYLEIFDGNWISNDTYGTIHRFASSFKYHGVFLFVQHELEKLGCNFRIDTHEDNIPMRKSISKAGYIYCGRIHPIEGGDRLAYEKVLRK